ncbi:hypothetical protein PP7435_CHR1-0394 [Komagataella phaffii CBS 7435]|uniref:Uncharacterized protein n=2 Tax=Komagataella phaffii TaxID=460519 RepID=C4QW29_KOMPG|nr:Hypothetical protein PAS_chr1-1_0092 [Komagataella phaffii GS115]AOA60965.1 GQ67_02661T0 [Komagataella phaffii]CAH2446118.1 hypothetical protein BQ9382_C1-2065 [Komagataella phaffii CBS 7435]AOA65510.1 GQ68_02587T0 [Komagataella phaffii GS115]CAY67452.1 Hypothetical protein PAS_chr1-1_0092 [Komagataella phaffii GS115]CCA36551.1 hypothetical protein PP7435_CHR1-0394 [Komagataella phaffii CBS 7435]
MISVFDSGDATVPDLPDFSSNFSDDLVHEYKINARKEDDFNTSDFSHTDEDDDSSDSTQPTTTVGKKKKKFYQIYQEPPAHKPRRPKAKNFRNYGNSNTSSSEARKRANWEPGIDVLTTDVVLNTIGSSITVTDYSQSRYRIQHLEVPPDSDSTSNLPLIQALSSKHEWGKVRWINVNGLSWNAISTISAHFKIHRLAIEDMVDIPQRTKIDQYPEHTFCCLPLVKLVKIKQSQDTKRRWFKLPKRKKSNNKATVPTRAELNSSDDSDSETITERLAKTEMRKISVKLPSNTQIYRRLQQLQPLSYRKLAIGIEQVSLFLFPDNVIVTFFEHSAHDIENAIFTRLTPDGSTILQKSCNPYILMQSIIDAIVDLSYPIMTAYRRKLSEMELQILDAPKIVHTRQLHLMISELSLLKQAISPTTSLLGSLRDYSNKHSIVISSKQQPKEFFEDCSLYLDDVKDHTLTYTNDIDMMTSQIENLVDLIFNTISVDTNSSMQQLSLVTVIFLPLSFWTGYYGMNFESFGDLEHNVSYYWKIAVPFCIVLLVLIMWMPLKSLLNIWTNKVRLSKSHLYIPTKIQSTSRPREQTNKTSEMSTGHPTTNNIV